MNVPTLPQNVRIVRADGTETPVDVEYIGTNPREVRGDIFIVTQWELVTETFLEEGDRIYGDFGDGCYSIRYRRVRSS